MHAYAGCLSEDQLVLAAIELLPADQEIRSVVVSHLRRLKQETSYCGSLDELGSRLLELGPADRKLTVRIDSMLSQFYTSFSAQTRKLVLERWIARGTAGATSRWLKAMAGDAHLLDIDLIVKCWLATNHSMAAALVAKRADPDVLRPHLPDFVERCGEGWTVGRAYIRAHPFSDECWERLRSKLPATYLYVCAKVQRTINDDEAVSLVRAQADTDWPGTDQVGLAIWSVGQMKMYAALEEIRVSLSGISDAISKSFVKFGSS
ncbi:MAG TPA: hypothetical protein VNR11_17325 [Xanthobacteraceae bacterium]|nr:hypothetical protein [Xanthobacteraceae bacterium]